MKICFVYKEDYPWDVRVEKITKSLVSEGHEVHLVVRNTEGSPQYEVFDGINLNRLPYIKTVPSSLNKLLGMPLFFNPMWLLNIGRVVRRKKIDIIIVRDLPLMLTGIFIAKIFRIKIIFDMAECYPEMYRSSLQFSHRKIMKFIGKNPFLADLIEWLCIRAADHIFVMIEESRNRLLLKGVANKNISIISNTPSKKKLKLYPKLHSQKNTLKLLYVGYVTMIRGIDNALYGLQKYNARGGKRIELNIIGVGAALSYYKEMTRKLRLDDHVNFLGWCSSSVVNEYFEKSDIGLLSYHFCSHWNSTIPNKLFDYMVYGMPVLATSIIPIKRIIQEVNCGLVFDDYDSAGFSDCLEKMQDTKLRQQFCENGYRAIKEKYYWEKDVARMNTIISQL